MTPSRRLEVGLPVLIVVLDQVTKAVVRRALTVHESVTIVPGLLDFTHVRNTGAVFGFKGAGRRLTRLMKAPANKVSLWSGCVWNRIVLWRRGCRSF